MQALEKKLEQDILTNIDINFLFAKGQKLQRHLIDQERLFKIMTKIKDLAKKQLEGGSKEIDYKEIVRFLKEKDSGFEELQECGESSNPNDEPDRASIVPTKEES